MARAPDYADKTDEGPTPPLRRDDTITPVLEPNEARQGVTRHRVRYVLAIGLAGVILAFAIVYLVFFSAPPAEGI